MTITRSEVMTRAVSAPWEPGTVEYSMEVSDDFPTGADCSAYVTYCWNVQGDFNTVTLVSSGLMYEIDPNDLVQGDAVGLCGPGTGGAAGHIQLFDKWLNDDENDNHYYCWHQNGDGLGPRYDLIDWPTGYKAYRYTGIVDEAPAPAPEPIPEPAKDSARYVTVVRYLDPPDGPAWNSTLSGIAEHESTTVEALLALNPEIVDPDLIYPDQQIRVSA